MNLSNDARFYYDEKQILKIWDVYARKQNIVFVDSRMKTKESMFENMKILIEAGVLFKKDEALYINSSGRSLSICGPVDHITVEEPNFLNAITHNLEIALKQIKMIVFKKNKKMEHSTIFPFHIKNLHWVLGVLDLDFDGKGNFTFFFQIYYPLKNGCSEIKDKVIFEIKNLLSTVFEIKTALNFDYNVNVIDQQNDWYSCGIITAENGKGFIENGKSSKIFTQFFDEEAKLLILKQHLNEVDSAIFNQKQNQNQIFNPKREINENDILNMIRELNASGLYEVPGFIEKVDAIELTEFVKAELNKKDRFQEHPFWNLLLEENGSDSLWAAKKYLER